MKPENMTRVCVMVIAVAYLALAGFASWWFNNIAIVWGMALTPWIAVMILALVAGCMK